jgi:glycosyltransferase involved in cell wall biosynthesis
MNSAQWIVVIATCGRQTLLGRTLEHLVKSGVSEAGAVLVIVENGGSTAARPLAADYRLHCKIDYISLKKTGKTYALNAVLNEYPSAFIWFVDDDIRVTEEAVRAYREAFLAAAIGHEFYGGPLGIDYERPPEPWLIDYLPRSATGWQKRAGEQAASTFFLGANWAAWAPDLLKCGGFDETLGPGQTGVGDEEDVQRRLITAGLNPVYLENAMVYHWVPHDRCSPQWVLRRAFNMGRLEGRRDDCVGPFFFGRPRWMYREAAARIWRWLATRLARNPARRFQAAYELAFFLGWMLEAKQRDRSKSNDAAVFKS